MYERKRYPDRNNMELESIEAVNRRPSYEDELEEVEPVNPTKKANIVEQIKEKYGKIRHDRRVKEAGKYEAKLEKLREDRRKKLREKQEEDELRELKEETKELERAKSKQVIGKIQGALSGLNTFMGGGRQYGGYGRQYQPRQPYKRQPYKEPSLPAYPNILGSGTRTPSIPKTPDIFGSRGKGRKINFFGKQSKNTKYPNIFGLPKKRKYF